MDRIKERIDEILGQLTKAQVDEPTYRNLDMRQTLIEELIFRHRQMEFKVAQQQNLAKRLE